MRILRRGAKNLIHVDLVRRRALHLHDKTTQQEKVGVQCLMYEAFCLKPFTVVLQEASTHATSAPFPPPTSGRPSLLRTAGLVSPRRSALRGTKYVNQQSMRKLANRKQSADLWSDRQWGWFGPVCPACWRRAVHPRGMWARGTPVE